MAKRITVKVAHLAQDMESVTVKEGATVKEVLDKLDITPDGDIFVTSNSVTKRAGLKTKVNSGDVIGITGQVEGGM